MAVDASLTREDLERQKFDLAGDGAVRVTITGGSSSGTEYTEDAAAAANPVGGALMLIRKDTPAAEVSADGDNVALRGSNYGAAYVTLLDTNGSPLAVGGGTQYTEDAAAAANPIGNAQILVRTDTPAASVSADGDNIAQRGTDYGAAYVTLLDTSGNPVSVGGGTQYTEDAAAAANPIGNALIGVRADALAGVTSADGDNVAARMTDKGELYVKHADSIAVTSATLATAANQTTIIGHVDGIEGLLVTIDADTSNISTKIDTIAGAVAGTEMQVDVLTLPAVTNGGTFVVQENGAALTALQLIDNIVLLEDAASASGDPGVQMLAVQKATPANLSGTDGDYEPLQVSAGRLWTSATIDAALPAGTNAIGKLAANSGVDIGDVDVTSILPGSGATNLGKAEDAAHASGDVGVMALGVSNEANTARAADGDYLPIALDTEGNVRTVGNRDHDAADAGEPVKVGARAVSAEISAVANNDRTDLLATLTGKLITSPYTNPENIVSGTITAAMTGTTSTSLVAAPGAGLRNYITTIVVSNAHATVGTDVIIQDGSGGTTLMTIPAAALYGGGVIPLPVPLRQPTTNTALYCANVTTGASTKVSAFGFKAA